MITRLTVRPGRSALVFLTDAAALFLIVYLYGSTHPDDLPTNIICWTAFALSMISLLTTGAFTGVWAARRHDALRGATSQ